MQRMISTIEQVEGETYVEFDDGERLPIGEAAGALREMGCTPINDTNGEQIGWNLPRVADPIDVYQTPSDGEP